MRYVLLTVLLMFPLTTQSGGGNILYCKGLVERFNKATHTSGRQRLAIRLGQKCQGSYKLTLLSKEIQ